MSTTTKRSWIALVATTAAVTATILTWTRRRRRLRKQGILVAGWCSLQYAGGSEYDEIICELKEQGVRLTVTSDPEALEASTEVLICTETALAEKCLKRLPNLRAFVLPYAGMPEAMRRLLQDHRLAAVANCHHNAKSTAEMAVALTLAAAKRLTRGDQELRRGDWRGRGVRVPGAPQTMPTIDQTLLCGKTALVVGFGYVGRRVATALGAGLGMRVKATARSSSLNRQSTSEVYPASALATLLREASVVVVCCPLNSETEGLVGEAAFEAMPDGAILVNVARGPVVDEAACFKALQSNKLAVYASDVWWNYPADWQRAQDCSPSQTHDFSTLPPDRVLLSPHRGGAVAVADTARFVTEAIKTSLLNAKQHGLATGLFTGDVKQVDLLAGY